MRIVINHHHHHHHENESLILKKLNQMAKTLDETLAAVQQNATVGDSAIALLTDIKTQLDEVLSGENLPPSVQAKVDAIFETVSSDTQKLQDAIVANTPAEEPTEPGDGTSEEKIPQ